MLNYRIFSLMLHIFMKDSFRMLIAAMLLYFHWEAMLVSYLSTRKTVMPFNSIEELYLNTEFRIALIPSTTFEDNFKYSKDPLWSNLYKERIGPNIDEYKSYENYLSDMVHFIRTDFGTAVYDSYDPVA